jgi:NADPH-dependent ferric siderophore reductase
MLLNRAKIASAEDVGFGFRRLVLQGDLPKPRAGTKLQLLLPSDDMRTYSPIASPEGIVLLGWKHAGGPGARWMTDVAVGSDLRFVGPQRSLELPEGPVVLVGDETSVAVAAAFEVERPGEVHAVFQAGNVDDVRFVAEAMGLRRVAVVPHGGIDGIVEAVLAARAVAPRSVIALTGGSELVIAVRAALRTRGIGGVKTKTYWVPGRTGLD